LRGCLRLKVAGIFPGKVPATFWAAVGQSRAQIRHGDPTTVGGQLGFLRTVSHFGPVVLGTGLAALGMHVSAFRSGVYEAVSAMWMGDSRVGDDV
jgi:hypothetical protein